MGNGSRGLPAGGGRLEAGFPCGGGGSECRVKRGSPLLGGGAGLTGSAGVGGIQVPANSSGVGMPGTLGGGVRETAPRARSGSESCLLTLPAYRRSGAAGRLLFSEGRGSLSGYPEPAYTSRVRAPFTLPDPKSWRAWRAVSLLSGACGLLALVGVWWLTEGCLSGTCESGARAVSAQEPSPLASPLAWAASVSWLLGLSCALLGWVSRSRTRFLLAAGFWLLPLLAVMLSASGRG